MLEKATCANVSPPTSSAWGRQYPSPGHVSSTTSPSRLRAAGPSGSCLPQSRGERLCTYVAGPQTPPRPGGALAVQRLVQVGHTWTTFYSLTQPPLPKPPLGSGSSSNGTFSCILFPECWCAQCDLLGEPVSGDSKPG